MDKKDFDFIMRHSLLRYFDVILDEVKEQGLSALQSAKTKKALAELAGMLPPLTDIETLVFSYYYVHEIKPEPIRVFALEDDLHLPGMYLRHESAFEKLLYYGFLQQTRPGEFIMPQNVLNAVSSVDLACYLRMGPTIERAERKEVFYRLAFDPEGKQGKLPDDW